MKPADIGNWSLLQVFQEGGRLLRQEFLKFWPCIVVCILPASLITVMHAQFDAVLPPKGYIEYIQCRFLQNLWSTDQAESKFNYFYLFFLIFSSLLFVSPIFLIGISTAWMLGTLKNTIYSDEAIETKKQTESLCHSSDLAEGVKDVETAKNPALLTTKSKRLLVEGIPRASKEKKLKTFVVGIVLCLLYYLGQVTGYCFTPEVVATVGLSPWMVFVFTLFITVLVTIFNSYLLLVYLTLITWLGSPLLELCGLDTSYSERGKRTELKDSSSPTPTDPNCLPQPPHWLCI